MCVCVRACMCLCVSVSSVPKCKLHSYFMWMLTSIQLIEFWRWNQYQHSLSQLGNGSFSKWTINLLCCWALFSGTTSTCENTDWYYHLRCTLALFVWPSVNITEHGMISPNCVLVESLAQHQPMMMYCHIVAVGIYIICKDRCILRHITIHAGYDLSERRWPRSHSVVESRPLNRRCRWLESGTRCHWITIRSSMIWKRVFMSWYQQRQALKTKAFYGVAVCIYSEPMSIVSDSSHVTIDFLSEGSQPPVYEGDVQSAGYLLHVCRHVQVCFRNVDMSVGGTNDRAFSGVMNSKTT